MVVQWYRHLEGRRLMVFVSIMPGETQKREVLSIWESLNRCRCMNDAGRKKMLVAVEKFLTQKTFFLKDHKNNFDGYQ